ncbi:hypothetical protein AMK11_20060 [Streptomyces sp. CB02414]|nr:hypothetical protein AMK11_20060 [Streptomyces sp. CB02414]
MLTPIAALGDVLANVSAALAAISLVMLGLSVFFPPLALASVTVGTVAGGFSGGALALHGTARTVGGDAWSPTEPSRRMHWVLCRSGSRSRG